MTLTQKQKTEAMIKIIEDAARNIQEVGDSRIAKYSLGKIADMLDELDQNLAGQQNPKGKVYGKYIVGVFHFQFKNTNKDMYRFYMRGWEKFGEEQDVLGGCFPFM